LRGGTFNIQSSNVRAACRNTNQPGNQNNNIGFRPASTLKWQRVLSPNARMSMTSLSRSHWQCASAKFRPSSCVIPVLFGMAKSFPGPAGLVGQKVRTPCRTTEWFNQFVLGRSRR
jgi:hypothetical protein